MAKQNEKRAGKPLLNNGKFFLSPPKDGSDFKELFKRLAAAGAGRPLGDDGFPAGPWTPDLLAEAISEIDYNGVGVDLRTVQLWFQENDKGISATNIRWLARIFGGDDPIAISEWQVELSEAQSRLAAKRRKGKKAESDIATVGNTTAHPQTAIEASSPLTEFVTDDRAENPAPYSGLAARSEALFSCGFPLNLPAAVFAGATSLGFLSYTTGIHSATFKRVDGVDKQVGFLWAPNWTLLFMAFLPLFILLVIEILAFWKTEGRLRLVAMADRKEANETWASKIETSSSTYWAVLVVCLVFAGLFQWVEVCLIPLMRGGGDYAMDWGKLAIVRPELISVPEAIFFTAAAYLYMAVCFYIFFSGLILLCTIANDFWKVRGDPANALEVDQDCIIDSIRGTLLCGIFRCTLLGVLVAICMKSQSSYLASTGKNIVAWLVDDMASAFYGLRTIGSGMPYRSPTHFSSLLVVVSSCTVFVFGSIRIGVGRSSRMALWRMSAIVTMLVSSYFAIGGFPGFSILLGVGVACAMYGLFNPSCRAWQANDLGAKLNVS